MLNGYLNNIETQQALCEIIYSIIEMKINEVGYKRDYTQLKDKVVTTFKKGSYFSNGIHVHLFEGKQMEVHLTIYAKHTNIKINDLYQLQEQIFEEVKSLTGCELTSINIMVKKLFSEETKKTH
jgi:uncharacterized alkaline shock family protein YloU